MAALYCSDILRDRISITMDNPCSFLIYSSKDIELEYSEFKVKKQKNFEKAVIKK